MFWRGYDGMCSTFTFPMFGRNFDLGLINIIMRWRIEESEFHV